MSDLRQQAVEAGSRAIYERTRGNHLPGVMDDRAVSHVGGIVLAEDALAAAEPFIRALVVQEVVHALRHPRNGHDTWVYAANEIEREFGGPDA